MKMKMLLQFFLKCMTLESMMVYFTGMIANVNERIATNNRGD
jgi:hypothetical protein